MENIETNWPEQGEDHPGVFFTSHDEVSFVLQQQQPVSKWVIDTAEAEGYHLARIDVVFCSDDFLLEINKQHLNHDFYTDIITFPLNANPIEAELYISIDRVKENAAQFNIPFDDELHRVIIHGVLHLCGYDDHDEKDTELMRKKEETYLNLLSFN